MLAKSDLPKVLYVRSTKSLSKEDAFDMFARFLNDERRRQNNTDHPSDLDTTNTAGGGGGGGGGEDYTSSSSSFLTTSMAQIWSELRMACNSLLDDIATEPTIMSSSSSNLSAPIITKKRKPVTPWKDDTNKTLASVTDTMNVNTTPSSPIAVATEQQQDSGRTPSTKGEKELTKDEKKKAKKERKLAKQAKKEAKQAKKEAKREKKEAKKKRKRDED